MKKLLLFIVCFCAVQNLFCQVSDTVTICAGEEVCWYPIPANDTSLITYAYIEGDLVWNTTHIGSPICFTSENSLTYWVFNIDGEPVFPSCTLNLIVNKPRFEVDLDDSNHIATVTLLDTIANYGRIAVIDEWVVSHSLVDTVIDFSFTDTTELSIDSLSHTATFTTDLWHKLLYHFSQTPYDGFYFAGYELRQFLLIEENNCTTIQDIDILENFAQFEVIADYILPTNSQCAIFGDSLDIDISLFSNGAGYIEGMIPMFDTNTVEIATMPYDPITDKFDFNHLSIDTITCLGNICRILVPDAIGYVILSVNGYHTQNGDAQYVYLHRVKPSPTFTVDSIHHVTCPDPYLGPGTSLYDGPWADGGFSVILDDSAQNYAYVRVNSDSYNTREFHDDFTVGGLRGGTYNIVARGTNGCEVTQQVTIQQPPAWGFDFLNYIWESYITCSDPATFVCGCIGGTPPYTWNWQFGFGFNPSDPPIWFGDSILQYPNSPTISVNIPGEYRCRYIDSHGCRFMNDNAVVFIAYQVLPDTVNLHYYMPEDSVTLIECPESMEVCQYKPFFNALSLGHGTYQWNTEWDTEFGHELDTTQNFTGPYQTGWLNVEFTDQNGCVTRDSVYLDIYDANISITADSIMNDDSIYTVSVYPSGGELYLDGNPITINNSQAIIDASQYSLGQHELFYVGTWGTFGCNFDTTFHFTIQHQDGVSEFERATRLWPNPASNILNIEFNGEFSGDIQLFDMTGRILKTTEKISERTSIDVSDLTSGVYFIHFVSQNGTFTKKFVKK